MDDQIKIKIDILKRIIAKYEEFYSNSPHLKDLVEEKLIKEREILKEYQLKYSEYFI